MGLTAFYKVAPFVLSTLIAILLIIVLVAGSSPSTLPNLYLLKVNTTNLHLPSKLSTSQFLEDLSQVSGTDLTGQPFNATTLGISDLYTIHIFTCCAQPDHCTAPVLGPSFDPLLHLRLGIGAVDKLPEDLEDALSLYRSVSPMLGAVLILGFVFVLSAPSVTLLSRRLYIAGRVALTLAALSAVLLLIGCIAGRVMGERLSRALNDAFEDLGITAEEGGLLYPAWAAIPVCFANTLLIFLRTKKESPLDFIEEREKAKEKARERERLKAKEKGKEKGKGKEKDKKLAEEKENERKAKGASDEHISAAEIGQAYGSPSDYNPYQAHATQEEGVKEPVMSKVARTSFAEGESQWEDGRSARAEQRSGEPPFRTPSVRRHHDSDAWYVNYRGVQVRRSDSITN